MNVPARDIRSSTRRTAGVACAVIGWALLVPAVIVTVFLAVSLAPAPPWHWPWDWWWWFGAMLLLGAAAGATGVALISLGRSMRSPRIRPGVCRGCGYDLTKLRRSHHCPECGTPF